MSHGRHAGIDGFASVDALVALIILSLTVVLALGALGVAARASAAAAENERAQIFLRNLLDSAGQSPGVQSGARGGFRWNVNISPSASPSGLPSAPLCERDASALSLRSGRRYGLTDEVICPPLQPS